MKEGLTFKSQGSKLLILVAVLVGVVILFVLLLARRPEKVASKPEITTDSITLEKEGGMSITFGKSGVVDFGGGFSEVWRAEDKSTLFDYIKAKLAKGEYSLNGGLYKIVINGVAYYFDANDEVINAVFDEGETGGSSVGDFFDFRITPTPTSKAGGGGGSGGSGGGGVDNCPFWRLSYCVYPPSPTPTRAPATGILPPECGANLKTGRTVITDELCLPSPTPRQ